MRGWGAWGPPASRGGHVHRAPASELEHRFRVAESDLKILGLALPAGWVMEVVHEFFFSWSCVFYNDYKCGACLHVYLNIII